MIQVRIAGCVIDPKKYIKFSLTKVKGVGKNNVKKILTDLKIDPFSRASDLDEQLIVKLRNHIQDNYIVEADLVREHSANRKRLMDINSWRGNRHKLHLPVRGQTTRTNSRTVRGNKKSSNKSSSKGKVVKR